MPNPIRISTIVYPHSVGKAYWLDEQGKLQSNADGAKQTDGIVRQHAFADIKAYVAWRRETLSAPDTLRLAGTFAESIADGARVGAKQDAVVPGSGLVARSKEFAAFRDGEAGIATIDADTAKAVPDDAAAVWGVGAERFTDAGAVNDYLHTLMPGVGYAGKAITPSTGSRIVNGSGMPVKQDGGWHVEIAVSDAGLIPDFLHALHILEWANGEPWAYVDKGGSVQIRGISDQALRAPTQPVFLAPHLGDGLSSQRECTGWEGELLRIDRLPIIDQATIDRTHRRMDEARQFLHPVAHSVTMKQIEAEVAEQVARGVDEEAATKAAHAVRQQGVLLGTAALYFKNPDETWTVADLLEKGSAMDGRVCSDPLDPGYAGGDPKGQFYWNKGYRPVLYNIHTKTAFRLRHDKTSFDAILSRKPLPPDIVRHYTLYEGREVEIAVAKKATAKALGLGNSTKAIDADVAKIAREATDFAAASRPADTRLMARPAANPLLPLPPASFPVKWVSPEGDVRIVEHVDNIGHILEQYGGEIHYDVIAKQERWKFPGLRQDTDKADVAFVTRMRGLAAINGLAGRHMQDTLATIADLNQANPVVDYLSALEWDGKRRLGDLIEEIGVPMDQLQTALIAFRLFFVGACAAADGAETAMTPEAQEKRGEIARATYEYVLSLFGVQGAGKTSGLGTMIPKPLREYYLTSVVLKINNKDSLLAAVSGWIIELGELDATFRHSEATAMKAFLSRSFDGLREAYMAKPSHYQRRCVFVGTINEEAFLVDATGNRRYLPVSATSIALDWSDAEIDQLWAENWHAYADGARWWPTTDEQALLDQRAEEHRRVSAVEEAIVDAYDWGNPPATVRGLGVKRKTATAIYAEVFFPGHEGPKDASNATINQVGHAMRKQWLKHGAMVDPDRGVVVESDGEWVRINSPGGRNRGWLLPRGEVKALNAGEGVERVDFAGKSRAKSRKITGDF